MKSQLWLFFYIMGFKTIIVNEDCKVNLEQNKFKVRLKEEQFSVPLKDINCVIFTHQKTVITIPIIAKMLESNIAVILCDKYNDPLGCFLPFNSHSLPFKQLENQINWKSIRKKQLWKLIIQEKILTENVALKYSNIGTSTTLKELSAEVKSGDSTNREGIAAKYYFRKMFGSEYFRNSPDTINFALNYGYKIIASYISKVIVSRGYLTQLGVHHIGPSNAFNLTYDFIETFRVIVDVWVKENILEDDIFSTYNKTQLVNLLNAKIEVQGIMQRLTNAIIIIIDSYFAFLNDESEQIINYNLLTIEYEE